MERIGIRLSVLESRLAWGGLLLRVSSAFSSLFLFRDYES